MSKRTYTEEEVQQLIRRAAELEAERSVSGNRKAGMGLTLDELRTVAADSGLDPTLIDRAATELEKGEQANSHPLQADVQADEISAEIWLEGKPGPDTLQMLVTELNHYYGVSKEVNWWDDLWSNYSGKAKIKKSPGCIEWSYTSSAGIYTTHALLQTHGNRFRIRISRRQLWGMEWGNNWGSLLALTPLAVVPAVVGGVVFNSVVLGIAAGIGLFLAAVPFLKLYEKRSLKKHQKEVAATAQRLVRFIEKADRLSEAEGVEAPIKTSRAVTLPDESRAETTDETQGRLRNQLRE
ncbi:MAG: hypothetical protein ACNA78_06265 [Balneolaceae bacterium]